MNPTEENLYPWKDKLFKHLDLELFSPNFDTELLDLIIELEKLRSKRIYGKWGHHPAIFFQIKDVFHLLESVESNRFESNPTTILEYIDLKLSNQSTTSVNEDHIAIQNVEKAIHYIEQNIQEWWHINQSHIRQIHEIVVNWLTPRPKWEWSENPWGYKKKPNFVGNHIPPPPHLVSSYMEELERFLNQAVSKKYELILTTMAHHRFSRIHPFDNGNWRVVRLLTYAMLVKQWFINSSVKISQVINPTWIFWNKKTYWSLLAKCDSWEKESIEEWCCYSLKWLLREINKIDKLLDYEYLRDKILSPSIKAAYERKDLNDLEYKILEIAIHKAEIKLQDIAHLFPTGKTQESQTYYIRKLKKRNLLTPSHPGWSSRKYVIWFSSNELLRFIVLALRNEGFVNFEDV